VTAEEVGNTQDRHAMSETKVTDGGTGILHIHYPFAYGLLNARFLLWLEQCLV
jgi:hypothetical protein